MGGTGQEDSKKKLMIPSPTPKEGAEGDEWEEEREEHSQGRLGLEGTSEHCGGEWSGTAGTSCGVLLWTVDD